MTRLSAAVLGLRVGYGLVLALAPPPLLAVLAREDVDRRACRLARVLGARELIQAELTRRRPSRACWLAGAAVDVVHGASMVLLARTDPRRRELAQGNATTAFLFAALSVLPVVRSGPTIPATSVGIRPYTEAG